MVYHEANETTSFEYFVKTRSNVMLSRYKFSTQLHSLISISIPADALTQKLNSLTIAEIIKRGRATIV